MSKHIKLSLELNDKCPCKRRRRHQQQLAATLRRAKKPRLAAVAATLPPLRHKAVPTLQPLPLQTLICMRHVL